MGHLAWLLRPRTAPALDSAALPRNSEEAHPVAGDHLLARGSAPSPPPHQLVQQWAARRGSSVVRMASEALNRHMIGVLQTVRSALSGAGVYERKGQVALGAQLDFSVDVKSWGAVPSQ